MQAAGGVRVTGLGLYRRLTLTIGLAGLFLAALLRVLQGVDPGRVLDAAGRVSLGAWVGAALATTVSFLAVAGYDKALHRHLATGIAPDRAARAGFAAVSIGQTVGLGVISGALVRWRMLPELGLSGALRLSVLVALSFLVAWAVVCAVVLTLCPVAALPRAGPLALTALLPLSAAVFLWPGSAVPNLITQGRLMLLAAVDCVAAGLALWLLIPGHPGVEVVLPVFLVALGAGLVSGAPAGLGAFEIVLLGLLPSVDPADLLAGVLAWRAVYHAAPALAGAGAALFVRTTPAPRPESPMLPPPGIAEGGLTAQGDLVVDPGGFVAGRTRHGLVALADVADLVRLRRAAADEARWPVIYKAAPRVAVRARRSGTTVLPVAREAWLDPVGFRLDIPARAGLRRKLRRAAAAGVVCAVDEHPDWDVLARVNARWADAHGGERGFSMGRFAPHYLAGQQLMVARQADRVIGFASFHRAEVGGREVWTLDLLRPDPEAAEGTAQSLVVAALDLARAAGVRRLSLAAVPVGCDAADRGFLPWVMRHCCRRAGGLAQFKAGFAPRWQRLYIAGPSWLALALVGWEIWSRVRRPLPLAKLSRTARSYEEYEIASDRNPWQRKGRGQPEGTLR